MRKHRISVAQQRILDKLALSPEGRVTVYPDKAHKWRGAWAGRDRLNWNATHALIKRGVLRRVGMDIDGDDEKRVYVRADQPT